MMSLGQIREVSARAAAKAARLHKRPFIVEAEDIAEAKQAVAKGRIPRVLPRFPFIGSYEPKGWVHFDTIFADSTGLDEDGPALSVKRLVSRLIAGRGYAIIEAGEFQVYIGEFVREEAQREAA